jgi:ketosteroid isomerase-like protein
MPPAAADTVRANSAAFSRRDVEAMLDLFAPDASVLDRRPVGWGEFRGHAALRSYYQGLFDNAARLNEELEVVFEDGGTVVASCRVRAQLAGQPAEDEVSFDYALRVTVGDGLIETLEIYEDVQAAGAGVRAPGGDS